MGYNSSHKVMSMIRLCILLFSCIISSVSFAQTELRVKSMTLTTDHIPAAEKRNDYNGQACALVKIQVVDGVEKIEGFSIGGAVRKTGVEHWVYMCHGAKSMKIHFRNHLPVEVRFLDFQIDALESNRVYELVLQDPYLNSGSEETQKLQKLILEYYPATATVLIDNVQRYGNNGRIEVELSVGEEHSYIIAANGYNVSQGKVILSSSTPRILRETLFPTSQMVQQQTFSKDTETRTNISKEDVRDRLIENRAAAIRKNYKGEKRTKKDRKDKQVKPEKRK